VVKGTPPPAAFQTPTAQAFALAIAPRLRTPTGHGLPRRVPSEGRFSSMVSREAAALAGCTINQLHEALRQNKMARPQRDVTGRYVWCAEDVQRLREAVAVDRRRKAVRR
jgi:hypothetical protein